MLAKQNEQIVHLQDLKPDMKRVSCLFIVIDLGNLTVIKAGSCVRTARVADETGSINLTVWNELSTLISQGDILRLTNGNTTLRNGCLTLNVGKAGRLVKRGEFCMHFCEVPDFSAVKYSDPDRPSTTKPAPASTGNPTDFNLQDAIGKLLSAKQFSTADVSFVQLAFCLTQTPSPPTASDVVRLIQHQLESPPSSSSSKSSRSSINAFQLLETLTCPTLLEASLVSSQRPVTHSQLRSACSVVRNAVLANLQDLSSLLLSPTTASPRNEEAGSKFLSLLLDWEQDILGGAKVEQQQFNTTTDLSRLMTGWHHPSFSSFEAGQLRLFLATLRRYGASRGANDQLTRHGHLLVDLEKRRRDLDEQQLINRQAREGKARLRVASCLKRVDARQSDIADNIQSLETLIAMLVPRPPDVTATSVDSPSTASLKDPPPAEASLEDRLRLHGIIAGGLSGFAASTSLSTITFDSSGPRVLVDDDNQVIADELMSSGRLLAQSHHPVLVEWIQDLDPSDLEEDSKLRFKATQAQGRLKVLLVKADSLLAQCFDELTLVDQNGNRLNTFDSRSVTVDQQRHEIGADDSDDDADSQFEDVSSIGGSPPLLRSPSRRNIQPPRSSIGPFISSPPGRSFNPQSPPSCDIPIIHCLYDKTKLTNRMLDTGHRFWQPIIDVEDSQPLADYLGSVIQLSTTATASQSNSTNLSAGVAVGDNDTSVAATGHSSPVGDRTSAPLFCWAPLLANGRLCKHRPASGNCPIHGKIVRRDSIGGRPVDPDDVERIRADFARQRNQLLACKGGVSHHHHRRYKVQLQQKREGGTGSNKKPNSPKSRLAKLRSDAIRRQFR